MNIVVIILSLEGIFAPQQHISVGWRWNGFSIIVTFYSLLLGTFCVKKSCYPESVFPGSAFLWWEIIDWMLKWIFNNGRRADQEARTSWSWGERKHWSHISAAPKIRTNINDFDFKHCSCHQLNMLEPNIWPHISPPAEYIGPHISFLYLLSPAANIGAKHISHQHQLQVMYFTFHYSAKVWSRK